MTARASTGALGFLLATGIAAGTHAETFRWAGTTDPQTMDPHAVSSAPVLGFLNNVYEGLVRRGRDMSIEPLVWGTQSNVELTQRPDNFFILRWARVN